MTTDTARIIRRGLQVEEVEEAFATNGIELTEA